MKKMIVALFGLLLWSAHVAASEPHSDNEEREHTESHQEESHYEDEHHDEHGKQDEHDEHEEEALGGIGPKMAVQKADKKKGIQLASPAIKRLEIRTQKITALPMQVPEEALVSIAESVGIYRLREGFFKLILLPDGIVRNREAVLLAIDSSEFLVGDEIVIQGAALLRVAELDAFSSGEEGHAH